MLTLQQANPQIVKFFDIFYKSLKQESWHYLKQIYFLKNNMNYSPYSAISRYYDSEDNHYHQ